MYLKHMHLTHTGIQLKKLHCSGHHPSDLLISRLTFKQIYQNVQQSAPKQKQIFTAAQPNISKWEKEKKITTLEGSVFY